MQAAGLKCTPIEMGMLFDSFDADRSGTLEYGELSRSLRVKPSKKRDAAHYRPPGKRDGRDHKLPSGPMAPPLKLPQIRSRRNAVDSGDG